MTTSIKVVSRVVITPGQEAAFEKHAGALSIGTRDEEGCLSYHSFVYVFVEDWASRAV